MSTDNIGITNWTWRLEEGSEVVIMEGPSVLYRFNREGTYIVTLTVKDGSGNVGTDTNTVEVEGSDEKTGSYPVLILSALMIMIPGAVSLIILVIRRKNLAGREEEVEASQEEH
jgi:hypothetical protein